MLKKGVRPCAQEARDFVSVGFSSLKAAERSRTLNSLTIKILLTVYILYALLKFFEFFFRDEETKRRGSTPST